LHNNVYLFVFFIVPAVCWVVFLCSEQNKNAMCTARAVRLTNDITDADSSSLVSATTSVLSPTRTSPVNQSASEDRSNKWEIYLSLFHFV